MNINSFEDICRLEIIILLFCFVISLNSVLLVCTTRLRPKQINNMLVLNRHINNRLFCCFQIQIFS